MAFVLTLTFKGRCMSLVLFGDSRTGKTLWARSLGAHIYNVGLVSGAECMKAQHVDYAVFDDIRGGIKFFPAFKEWLGAQKWVSVKQLYRDPKLVEWGKPSIWISNDDPRHSMDPGDISWMETNCIFVEVTMLSFVPIQSRCTLYENRIIRCYTCAWLDDIQHIIVSHASFAVGTDVIGRLAVSTFVVVIHECFVHWVPQFLFENGTALIA